MQRISKKWLISLLVIAIVIFGGRLFYLGFVEKEQEPFIEEEVVVLEEEFPKHEIIGASVEGREIESFTYRNTDANTNAETNTQNTEHLVFVGGMHGGYEWNTVVLAYEMMDYLDESPEVIPENIMVTIIPSANPDGIYKIIGKEGRLTRADAPTPQTNTIPGRFNANDVDLNRNFDCKWEPKSMWRGNEVSAGDRPFSEPEAVAIRDFVLGNNPRAVIFWHSQANAVFASECEDGILPETLDVMNIYAEASEYRAIATFDAYPITGDAEGWLASIGIPAVTVELETHETIEFERNLASVLALFEYYSD